MNITALKSADTQPRDTSDGQYTGVKVQTVTNDLKSGKFWFSYNIVKSPGDGHCIMHSIVNSLNVCAASGVTIYDVNGRVDLLNGLSEYINDKIYDTSFGDLVPVILTNALSVNLLIVEKNGVNYDVHFLDLHAIDSIILMIES